MDDVTLLSSSLRNYWYNSKDYSPDAKWKAFDPSKAALVLVDLINWQAHPGGASPQALREAGVVPSRTTSSSDAKRRSCPTCAECYLLRARGE